ncbi:XylR N-terminal domain-containing protein [Parageobacillus thermoglucosidasius]|uniref:XylR N-terminal domain-containing protein n=1 Tax=Parageobacillus thermoglucosidasius TaxID=1426 RepID=UPI000B54E605|nr:XylR N-terminal domain-containing protein [Parageobacillus thermoglucosidasius]OUM91351.1 MAG: PucR family transcriptional regulator [Parageobacillus thermoglucosidasius]
MNKPKSVLDQLELKFDNGYIYMGQSRSMIVATNALGLLRRDLIRDMGFERMKGFLFRYGWNLGRQDAKELLNHANCTVEEYIQYGPTLHTMKGHVKARCTFLELKRGNGKYQVTMEGYWSHSYEAEEHVRHFGISSIPVCFTLSGYASGFVSEIIGEKTIFKEMACQGMGKEQCHWIGKTVELWGKEVEQELCYLDESPIVEELAATYEKLLEERNNLKFVTAVHKKLTEEIIKGNNLDSVVHQVFQATNIPVLIENLHLHPMAYAGIPSDELEQYKNELVDYLGKNPFCQPQAIVTSTHLLHLRHHYRLMTPIFLQNKIVGYCSFIYHDLDQFNASISPMILERLASVGSVCLLNEKTKLESYERMKGFFLEEIINAGQQGNYHDLIMKAGLIGVDLSKPFYICVLDCRFQEDDLSKELELQKEILSFLTAYGNEQKQNMLIGQRAKHLILLVTEDQVEKAGIQPWLSKMVELLSSQFSSVKFYGGISSKVNNVSYAGDAYKEALTSVRVASKHQQIISFESLGVVGVLINEKNEQEVKKIAKACLGNLKLDDPKNIELLRTLYIFLVNGGNLEQTAADLALSISGLRYRVSKIESILQQELRNPMIHHQLLLSIQSLMMIGEIDIGIK